MTVINNFSKILLSALLVLGVVACTPVKRGEYVKGSATVFSDEGFRNIIDEEIEVFEYTYPESSIIPFYVSQEAAIDSFLADKTEAIVTTSELSKDQIAFMKKKYKRIVRSHCIAVDAVALIANKDNPVQALSMEEIGDILNGRITRWNQLGAPDTTNIKLVFDNTGSSVVSYMRDKFLQPGEKIKDKANAFAQNTNAAVFDVIKKDRSALGLISVSWLGDNLQAAKNVPLETRTADYTNRQDSIISVELTTEVNILKVSNPNEENDFSPVAYKPYQAYIATGQYPLFRKVYMITSASKSNVVNSFYTFVTGFTGQKIISRTGILPYHMNPRLVELKQTK